MQTAKAHFKQGRASYEAGAWEDAVREYEKAYALAPLADLLYNIGQAYRLKGDKAKAIEAYQRYLSAVSEGALADEARSHVAALRLKIQVEAAEAAKRKALEEAEAARRRAQELEEARRRAETDTEARMRRLIEERSRHARLAAEAALAAQQERDRRLAEAGKKGRGLRGAGIAAMVVGSLGIGLGVLAGSTYTDWKALRTWNNNSTDRWSTQMDKHLRVQREDVIILSCAWVLGPALVATGVLFHELGRWQGKRARRSAERPITLVPQFGPDSGGLVLQGRF